SGMLFEKGAADEDMMVETAKKESEEEAPSPVAESFDDTGKEKQADTSTAVTGKDKNGEADLSDVKIRKNFSETAFFYPELLTNAAGEIIVSFTVPEALTRWKMLGFAHTKDLKYGMIQNELVTQKELMVVPNPPRFFREGDTITFTAKISNLSEKDLQGNAGLELFDAFTMKPVDIIDKDDVVRKFDVRKGGNTSVKWRFSIPDSVQAITYRIAAKSGDFSDGEEQAVPVLNNRMLVTESMPLYVNSNEEKSFEFTKLLTNKSTTLKNRKLTLEFTTNPVWYAIQALPYMMEYPYECTEQVFNRYYANSLSSYIVNKKPKIKKVFDTWRKYEPQAFLSNLEKNTELKSLVLEETPWVLDATDESERKRQVALLFDLDKMAVEKDGALKKLEEAQYPNGGWPWFKGMPDSEYITCYIVAGIGHLKKMGVLETEDRLKKMIAKALPYLDMKMKDSYLLLKSRRKSDGWDLSKNHTGYDEILYFYARSFFTDIPVLSDCREGFEYFKWQMKTYWTDYIQSRYFSGLIALSLNRFSEETPKEFQKIFTEFGMKNFLKADVPGQIIKSLREYALYSDEMGMYWKQSWGWFWYELPIETQALMCEVFTEVANDRKSVDLLKTWLLKQKQTQNWETTKATSEAVYALVYSGGDWMESEGRVEITLGKERIDPLKSKEIKTEAGTGYFKTSWEGDKIYPGMGKIIVKKMDTGIAWGGVYWQYFENLDRITPHETPLKLNKKLFLVKDSKTGPVLSPVEENTKLKPGDKIRVRIELRVDRDMEYVHMKDMRASCFEPVNVLSRYKYQDGLGYYESTRDASTNFFFDYLPKGTYVFEYSLFASQSGDFSNGITTIQCMYAPEFTSHSEGVRVTVQE
ncbi:MAG: hypothetical protein JW969_04725, partial [Spirochaetales bacterium]|nr:hypothetical protein [Spirochaetales bacterium]